MPGLKVEIPRPTQGSSGEVARSPGAEKLSAPLESLSERSRQEQWISEDEDLSIASSVSGGSQTLQRNRGDL
eukprot:6744262-Pyramimonas_sp.AAC.1